jgi:molybdate transport system ATP-binding protein
MPERDTDYVVLSNATFRAAKGAVFANTNWRLVSGERWAVRGVSGAGKSLFLAAITGKLPRLAGALRHPFLEGRPHCADSIFGVLPRGSIAVASMDQHRAILSAREFHQLRWHGSLTSGAILVREFLSQASVTPRNPFAVVDQDAAEVDKFAAVCCREVERWDLERMLERPVLALSNGELHRLLVARALMLEPRLLIVDDPYTGLDARTRALLTLNLAALEEAGTGVLYAVARDEDVPATVTHELEIASCVVKYAGARRSVAVAQAASAPATRLAVAPAARSSGVVLELRGVSVRQGDVTLLKDVDFTIRDEERWALVGPNGAGKSTLLSLILADNPQSYCNCVVVGGRQLGPGTSIWDIKRLVGWVSPELDAH